MSRRLTEREQEQVAQIMTTIAEIRATANDLSRRVGVLEELAREDETMTGEAS